MANPSDGNGEPSIEELRRAMEFLETPEGHKLLAAQRYIEKAVNKLIAVFQKFESELSHPEADTKKAYEQIGEFIVKFSHLEAIITMILGV